MKNQSDYLSDIFGLKDKVVVLTGGMGKLGTEFAHALTYAGAKVAILDIVDTPNDRLKTLSEKFPVLFLKTDITEEAEIEKALDTIEKKWGTPSVLVNNVAWKASVNDPKGAGSSFEKYSMDLWDKIFALNTASAAKCAKIFGGRMVEKKITGSVVNIVSIYALVSPDQRVYEYREKIGKTRFIKDAAYGASKAALIALTRDLATLWAPKNIRVNALALGGVESQTNDKEFIQNYSNRVPIGRMAHLEEYDGALLFLVSDASSYVTGTTLVADGGWTAW